MLKHSTLAVSLLSALGVPRFAPKAPTAPAWVGYVPQHTNPEKNAKRRAKRLIGARQERRQRCYSYNRWNEAQVLP